MEFVESACSLTRYFIFQVAVLVSFPGSALGEGVAGVTSPEGIADTEITLNDADCEFVRSNEDLIGVWEAVHTDFNFVKLFRLTVNRDSNPQLWQADSRTRGFVSTVQSIKVANGDVEIRMTGDPRVAWPEVEVLESKNAFKPEILKGRGYLCHTSDHLKLNLQIDPGDEEAVWKLFFVRIKGTTLLQELNAQSEGITKAKPLVHRNLD